MFSRKLLHADGRFAGVLQISLNASEMSRFYGEIVGDKGYAMLVGVDGVIRARGPSADGVVGRSVDQSRLKATESQPIGSLTTTSQSNETQVVSFRRVTDYPLTVVVAFDEKAIYGSYWKSHRHLLLMALLSTAFVLSFGVVWAVGLFNSRAVS